MTDTYSGQQIKHLQMIQIELPRARHNVFPPKKDFTLTDWWLSIFKYAPSYTNQAIQDLAKEGIVMPPVIAQALERLYFPKWNPQTIHEYKTDTIEKEKYAVEFASEREEGRQEGREEERQKHLEEKQSMARQMIQEGINIDIVSRITDLSAEEIQVLKTSPDEVK